ncbi:MCE family protein, partial [bacterium]|nr:MCE family protein [bacterium]
MLSQETKVGLFVLAGGIILAVVVVFLGDIPLQKGYTINVLFDDIAGLPEKAPVKISGVEVGKVLKIKLVKNKACVEVWINSKIKIYSDTKARIISTGVIGTKYMEMTMGSVDELMLKDGDTVKGINPIG